MEYGLDETPALEHARSVKRITFRVRRFEVTEPPRPPRRIEIQESVVRNEGIGSWLDRRMVISPRSEALVFEGTSYSYTDLALRTRQVAHGLRELGVTRGTRVGFFGFNDPAALEILFAAGLLGAVYVPPNARLTAAEAEFVLRDSECDVLIFGTRQAETTRQLSESDIPVTHWIGLTETSWCDRTYSALADGQPTTAIDEPVGLDELCLIMYSSGTTGNPKGVMLSHGNMLWNALNQILSQDITSSTRALSAAPLFHIGGLGGAVTPTLLHGGTVVLLTEFKDEHVLSTIEEQRITTFFAVPTMIQSLWHQPNFADTDLSNLRAISVAGAPVPEALITPWLERGVAIEQAYGLTEAVPSVSLLASPDARRKAGSAGRRTFFTDVDVVRPDGSSAAPGEIGEIVAKGPNVMVGYLNQPDATERTVVDGWVHAGDPGFNNDGRHPH